MPTPAAITAVTAALPPSMLPIARSAAGASIGMRSIPAFLTAVGAPDHPVHTSADHTVPRANVASAVLVRVPAPLSARYAAAASNAAPVSDERTANPADPVAYDVTFGLRLPSAITAELVAIVSPPAVTTNRGSVLTTTHRSVAASRRVWFPRL